MKKILTILSAIAVSASSAFAGGFITNTNQSAAFLRMPAQEAVISVDGAYFNPAGIGFLDNGLHFGFNWQAAKQTRESQTYFAPFAYGAKNNREHEKTYVGKATAPFIPSFDLAYVGDRFFVSGHFGVLGGGGKLTYDDGIGSFEANIASASALFNTMGLGSVYDMDMRVEGTSYYFGGQVNFGMKISDNLSISAGLRGTYATGGYNAYIKNITFTHTQTGLPVASVLMTTPYAAYVPAFASMMGDKNLDCKQSGFGVNPIVGIDYKTGKWNFAARYEFATKLSLKNKTKENTTGMAQYDDAKVLGNDIPSLLAIGASYSPLEWVRLYGSTHIFGDKKAATYNPASDKDDKQDLLGGNTVEILGGIEVDVLDVITLSTGFQHTAYKFGESKAYISDMNMTTNSNSLALGAKIDFSEKLSFDIACFKSFFDHLEKKNAPNSTAVQLSQMLNNPALSQIATTDKYYRTSMAFAAGIKIKF